MNKILDFFKTPSPFAMAVKELEEANRELLQAQSAADYAINMCKYNQDRITRLTEILRAEVLDPS
jgi:hypothetical protein